MILRGHEKEEYIETFYPVDRDTNHCYSVIMMSIHRIEEGIIQKRRQRSSLFNSFAALAILHQDDWKNRMKSFYILQFCPGAK